MDNRACRAPLTPTPHLPPPAASGAPPACSLGSLTCTIGPDPPGLVASDSHQPLCGLLLRATCGWFHSPRCFSRCSAWLAPHPGGLSLRVASSEAPSPNSVLKVGPPIPFLICVVSHSVHCILGPSFLPSSLVILLSLGICLSC